MTGRRPFSELTKTFAPGRKARVAAKVRELKAQMPLAELRQVQTARRHVAIQRLPGVDEFAVSSEGEQKSSYLAVRIVHHAGMVIEDHRLAARWITGSPG